MAYHSWKPNIELAPICSRCDSSNTKFCYYNYSLTQPRYFCKGCKRYWTKGGTLWCVPIGGGCRKNWRGKSARPQANEPTSHGDINYRSSHAQHESDLLPSEGSTIDLVLIYTKFVNQRPELNSDLVVHEVPGEIMDESFSVIGGAQNSAMKLTQRTARRSQKLHLRMKLTQRTATSLWIQAARSRWHSPLKELLLVMTFLCQNVGLPQHLQDSNHCCGMICFTIKIL